MPNAKLWLNFIMGCLKHEFLIVILGLISKHKQPNQICGSVEQRFEEEKDIMGRSDTEANVTGLNLTYSPGT